MPAAIAIPLVIGAASTTAQLASAKMSSNAAKNAARTQSASADKALALQQTQYEEQKARQAPYVQAGQQSVQRLSDLMTPNAQGQYPYFGAPPQNGMMPSNMGQGMPPQGGQFRPQPSGPMGMAQPQQGGMMPQQSLAAFGQPSGQMGAPMGGGGTVKMQAPDGSTRDVPAAQRSYYEAKGAKVIN